MKIVKQLLSTSCLIHLLATVCLAQGKPDLRPKKKLADSLYQNFDEQQALNVYKKLAINQPKNLRAAWRVSFLYARLGNRFEKKDQKKEYFNKAIRWAKKSLAIDSTSSQANFVMGVAKGRMALVSGGKQRVSAARRIKRYADRAIKYDSTNAGAWHLLGRWNLKIANLGWLERIAANTLFGGIPGDASNLKAANYIEKAISIEDSLIIYHRDLARAYKKMGWEQKATEQCHKVIALPKKIPDDRSLKKDCRKLIVDIKK